MPRSIDAAREEIRTLLEAGVDLGARPPIPAGMPVRRSAVLILFGSLDRVPARVGTRVSGDGKASGLGRGSARDAAVQPDVPVELDVLLMRRADSLRHHAGQVSFPGGGAEPGDADPIHTALREAAEETGLDPSGVEILGTLPEIPLAVSGNLVTPVVGWWARPSTVAADDSESVEVFRSPVAELLDPAARGTSIMRRDGMVFRGPAFELRQGHTLWGFTGVLLSTLFDRLGWAVAWDETRLLPVTTGERPS